jgi:hypothetical protein
MYVPLALFFFRFRAKEGDLLNRSPFPENRLVPDQNQSAPTTIPVWPVSATL